MKIGTIEVEGTGLTNGHPAVIISGKMADDATCVKNGLLAMNKTTGEFEAYNFNQPAGAVCIALETITETTKAAKVLLHGTFDGSMAVKAGGASLTVLELAAAQANSQIFFV